MSKDNSDDEDIDNKDKDEEEELPHWEPVSNIPLDPYEDVDEKIRDYHRNYVRFWLGEKRYGK